MSKKRSTEKSIRNQLKNFRNQGLKNQTVTISIPIITQDKRMKSSVDSESIEHKVDFSLKTLNSVLGYTPSSLDVTPLYSDDMVTLIVKFKLE